MGRSRLFEKKGDFNQANEDFDSLSPENVRDLSNGGRIGTLPDGRTIVVRPDSTQNVPTLEIQDGRRRIKIRFFEKEQK